MNDFLTSAEAAALLGVSASTVKRWVDDGALAAERTAGGHRRVRRTALLAFRDRLGQAGGQAGDRAATAGLVELLLGDAPARDVEAQLLARRGAVRTAADFAEGLAPVLRELGGRWERGEITIADEHVASERLARGLARLTEWVPLAANAPRALLATAIEDEHTLGLSLLEICLREAGWATRWAGRRTPTAALVAAVERAAPPLRLVALSASIVSSDVVSLAWQERAVGEACRRAGATLLVGGGGAWPARPRHAKRAADFHAVERFGRLLIDKSSTRV